MKNTTKFTPISELGEVNLIKRLSKNFTNRNPNTILGIGDDAAIIKSSPKQQTSRA